jgi:hypothetical protein
MLGCFFQYRDKGGVLPAFKIHCKTSEDGYALAAHNEDFTTLADPADPHFSNVFHFERFMRLARLIRVLKYKPDVYSVCGITHSRSHFRPTVLKSTFNTVKQESEIVADYTTDYEPEVTVGVSFRNRI